jgi:hypothetical protein
MRSFNTLVFGVAMWGGHIMLVSMSLDAWIAVLDRLLHTTPVTWSLVILPAYFPLLMIAMGEFQSLLLRLVCRRVEGTGEQGLLHSRKWSRHISKVDCPDWLIAPGERPLLLLPPFGPLLIVPKGSGEAVEVQRSTWLVVAGRLAALYLFGLLFMLLVLPHAGHAHVLAFLLGFVGISRIGALFRTSSSSGTNRWPMAIGPTWWVA